MKYLKEISIVVLMFGAEFYLFQANSHSAINVFRGINWDLVFLAVFLPFFLASYIMTYIHDLFVALKVEEENDIKGSFIVGLLIFAIILWWNCATVFTKDQFDAVVSVFTFPLFGFLWFLTKKILGLRDRNNHHNSDE